jgi:hypothetical protein
VARGGRHDFEVNLQVGCRSRLLSADQNLRGRLEEIEGRQWLIVASSLYQTLLLPYPDWCQEDVQALALRKHQERDWEHRDLVRDVQEVVTTALALVVKPECPQATGMTIRLGSGNSISDQVAEAPGFIVRLREPVPVVPEGGFRCGKVTVDLSGEPTPRLAARVPAGDLAAARDSIQCAVRLAADYVSKISGEGRVPASLALDVTVDGKVVQTNTLERRYGWHAPASSRGARAPAFRGEPLAPRAGPAAAQPGRRGADRSQSRARGNPGRAGGSPFRSLRLGCGGSPAGLARARFTGCRRPARR